MKCWVMMAALLVAGPVLADYEYTCDFESVKLGRLTPGVYVTNAQGNKDEHLGVGGAKECDETLFAEVADGAGYDNSRGLRVVDKSAAKMLHGEFTVAEGSLFNGATIFKGVLRFDIFFDELPDQPFFLGRRNFGIDVGANGKGISVGGIDKLENGAADSVRSDFAFEAKKWYRVWIQFEAPLATDEKQGRFFAFIKPADGKDDFKPENMVIANAAFKYDVGNDGWRIVVPANYNVEMKTGFRLDNFALFSGVSKMVAVPKKEGK